MVSSRRAAQRTRPGSPCAAGDEEIPALRLAPAGMTREGVSFVWFVRFVVNFIWVNEQMTAKSPPAVRPEGCCRRGPKRGTRISSQRGANLVGDGLERCRIGPRDVGEHLAVDLDAGLFKAVNKSGVGEAFQPAGRVDP